MKRTLSRIVGSIVAIAALGATLTLAAANLNPTVLPVHASPFGQTYSQWADAWCQWAMSLPEDKNPMLDQTGESAALGQSGPVWFLAGTMGGAATRTVTVPPGKALFFPIYQALWINLPEFGDAPWSEEQEEYVRASLDEWYFENLVPANLTGKIDGRPVANLMGYRCPTGPGEEFLVNLPANDAWGLDTLTPVPGETYEPGLHGPCLQDGYYLMLTPLPVGEHVIHFTAPTIDVTYHITVLKPNPASQVEQAPEATAD